MGRNPYFIAIAFFGIVGYFLVKFGAEPAPLLLGFVLAPLLEQNLRRAMTISRGDATVFFTRDVPALLGWRYDRQDACRVTAPVLYVGGAQSGRWFGQVHDWVRDLFPQAEHHVLAGAGHTVVSTHTDVVARLLAGFLRRVEG